MRRVAWGMVALCWTLWSVQALADEYHRENLRYGQQAMGMGGASVALPGEPEASYYNPAGLAFLEGAVLSGALLFFGYDGRSLRESFRAGTWFAPQDESSEGFQAVPSSSVIAKAFGDDGEHVLAFTSFLASTTHESFRGRIETAVGRDGVESIEYNSTRLLIDDAHLLGLSYAWRPLERLGFGLSLFYAKRDSETARQQSQIFDRVDGAGAASSTFFDATASSTLSDGALLARLGVFFRPTAELGLGASCTPPSVHLHGDAELSFGLVDSGDASAGSLPQHVNEVRKGLEATTEYPWGCRLGGSWVATNWLRLAADVSVWGPTSYRRISGLTAAEEASFRLSEQMLQEVEQDWLVNAALGVEWLPDERWPLRAGFYTNRSAAPSIPAEPTRLYAPAIDLYGVTFSAGYRGEDRSLNLGADVAWGSGYDVALSSIRGLLESPQFLRVERDELRLLFFVSGAFEFARKTAEDLFE